MGIDFFWFFYKKHLTRTKKSAAAFADESANAALELEEAPPTLIQGGTHETIVH